MFTKIYKLFLLVLMFGFLYTGLINAQVSVSSESIEMVKVKAVKYPIYTISPLAGGVFPISELGNSFKAGFSGALDLGVRLNKEVGIYTNVSYNSLTTNTVGAPNSSYFAVTAGPRYYFTKSNLKSTFFIETGVGAYIFSQDAYGTGADYVDRKSYTNVGLNLGPGFTMQAGGTIDFILKAKYNMVFNEQGTRSYVTGLGGIEIKF